MDDIFNGKGVEISIAQSDDFLKIKETLTRIGISSKKEQILYQSCHILHKKGRYVILHFKELFELDGKYSDITDNDLGRRNTITKLLEDWGLLKICDIDEISDYSVPINQIKIISFKEKKNWQLINKYSIGNNNFKQKNKCSAPASSTAASE